MHLNFSGHFRGEFSLAEPRLWGILCTSNHNWYKPDIASYHLNHDQDTYDDRWPPCFIWFSIRRLLVHQTPNSSRISSGNAFLQVDGSNMLNDGSRLKEPQGFCGCWAYWPPWNTTFSRQIACVALAATQHSFWSQQSLSTITLTSAGENPWPLILSILSITTYSVNSWLTCER